MDLLSLLRLFARHWTVTVPAGVLTLIGVMAAVGLASPTYEATGSVVLLSPPEAPEPEPGATAPLDVGQNPYARYGDLAVVADILARVMDSDSRRTELEAQDVTGYEVAANRESRGPVIEVTGAATTADAAISATELVLADVDGVLAGLQDAEGADPGYYITAAPLDPPSAATAMYGSTVRAAIGALVFGALCTLALAVGAEAVVRRRGTGPEAVPSTVEPVTGAEPAAARAADGAPSAGRNGGRVASLSDPRPVRPGTTDRRTGRSHTARTAVAPTVDPVADDPLARPTTDLRP